MECKTLTKSRAVHCILSARQLRLRLSAHLLAHLLAQLLRLLRLRLLRQLRLRLSAHLLAQPLPHPVTPRQAQLQLQLRCGSAYLHFAMSTYRTNISWKALKIACLALTLNEGIS